MKAPFPNRENPPLNRPPIFNANPPLSKPVLWPQTLGVVKPVPSSELVVSLAGQKLDLVVDGRVVRSFPVSTSKFGTGFEEGSQKTPTGRFSIAEKFGDGEPVGAVFRGRRPTGEVFPSAKEGEDLVLTRIMWLEGLDPHNANTRSRYIYIHGTNREDLVGVPSSHGCIRMRNADIVELFDTVIPGTPVRIA